MSNRDVTMTDVYARGMGVVDRFRERSPAGQLERLKHRVRELERDNRKYQELERELGKRWSEREWQVVTIVLVKLGEEDPRSSGCWTMCVGDEAIAIWAGVSRSFARRVMKRLVRAGMVGSIAPSGSRPRRYRMRWKRHG